MGRRALAVQADVSLKADIDRMFDRVEADFGPVDILVNNAGIEPRADVSDFDEATYDAIMATNLKGAFFCAQRALRKMRDAGWGRVINISSLHELTPTGFSALYGMSKGGMALMMREMAKSYSHYGITINNVCPGDRPLRTGELITVAYWPWARFQEPAMRQPDKILNSKHEILNKFQ